MKMLDLKTALEIMENGKPFSLACISLDVSRKTGGEKKFYSELIAMKAAPELINQQKKFKTDDAKKVPQNRTRKYFQCIGGRPTTVIKQIHLFGILEVNNQKVAL